MSIGSVISDKVSEDLRVVTMQVTLKVVAEQHLSEENGHAQLMLAAILGTCPAACADRLRLPPEIDACPLFDSSPCVDHGWPPYATLKPDYAEEASVTSSSRQTDHITG
ncbi:hypothetical protein MRX96_028356 [Rhipicephalus microplus]